jgi:hypothetical protein
MFDKIKNKSKELNDSIKEKAGELGGKATSLLGDGLAEINGLKPVLEKSGFIIGDVFFGLSLPPKIGIIVEQKAGGVKNLDSLSDNENLSKLQSAIISSIQKVYKMNEMVENHDHTIGQIEVEMGLPPGIKVHLNSKESRAFAS